jgi:hypothetical protein
MFKTYKGLLSLVCGLLLGTAFTLPVAAQKTTPSDDNQNIQDQGQISPSQSTQPSETSPSQVNPNDVSPTSDQYNSDTDQQGTDVNRQKPADTGVRQDQGTSGEHKTHPRSKEYQQRNKGMSGTTTGTSEEEGSPHRLPRTASPVPMSGLIGAVSMLGFAIRRWL